MADVVARLNEALEGRYRIEREIGEGGMATVYLADDLKHERKVALKVLKPELAAVVGADRFLGEIKTTANLHHPHILPLFDSGEADSFLFYVMPYVEGETLRERIDREKQLPVDVAVTIAISVASALQHAHERGVIHRDIKPANILMQDGQPVVSDFGIALAVGAAGGSRLTETGLSVGTPFYMSPEQATGDQQVGPPSDTYSLAAVLYEMLTGDPPYIGSTAQAVLGKILRGEPVSATGVRKSVPPHVDAALRKALEKLPADRFTGAQDFARALADPAFRHGGPPGSAADRARGVWNPVSLGLAATTVLLAGSLVWSMSRPEPEVHVERFAMPFEAGQEPMLAGLPRFALSPDGTALVYTRMNRNAASELWLRRWDELSSSAIRETTPGGWPAVSPDGLELAFALGSQIKALAFSGGPVRTLVSGVAPVWGTDGYIYVSAPDGVVRVPSTGGAVERVTSADAVGGNAPHLLWDILPGGRRGIVEVTHETPGEVGVLHALDLRTGELTSLTSGTGARYAPTGHLLYLTGEGTLMAARMDPGAGRLTGVPVAMIESIAGFTLAADGKLVYSRGGAGQLLQLMWVSRAGSATPVDDGWTFDPSTASGNRSWSLSPDGTRIAVKIQTELGADIWIKTLSSGTLSRLTFYEGEDRFARWAPDGETVTFLSDRGGDLDVWSRKADGTGSAELVLDTEGSISEGALTPDGEWLLLRSTGQAQVVGNRDIFIARARDGSEPEPLLATDYDESAPAVSPDGRWVAYQSNETGRREVFVRPFPDVDAGKWQVSSGGGRAPLWAHGGREIFYLTDDNAVVTAAIDPGPPFVVGERRTLFETGPDYYFMINSSSSWDVTADDQTFLMARTATAEGGSDFVLVNHFFEELKRRVPE